VRRFSACFIAFLALTATLVVLPVYAAPAPEATPVEASVEEIALGSLEEPAADADVQVGTTAPTAGVPDTAPVLTVSETETEPFALVGVTWAHDPGVTDTVVQVRVQDTEGDWGEWTAVAVEDSDQDVDTDSGAELRGGTSPLWTGPSTGVEVELVTRSGAQPTDVQLDLVDPGTSEADASLESPEITDTANAAAAMPPVYSRAQWGADESIRTWDPQYAPTVKAATIHHTADSNNYTSAQVPQMMRSIYQYHTVSRGWGDIGYNVIVDKFGRLWEGRYGGLASTVVGAHAGGFNTGTFGVSMLGNYDVAAAPQVMLSAAADIIAWKFALYQINPRGQVALVSGGGGTARWAAGTRVYMPTIFGHRDVGLTACPGQYAYARMDDIRAMVAARIPNYGTPTKGNVEQIAVSAQTITVRGWTFDPHEPTQSATVAVQVDGRRVATLTANQLRADVGSAYPEAGSRHGFSGSVTVSAGSHETCVTLLPISSETLQSTRCATVEAVDPERLKEPIGNVESATVVGRRVSLRGWTLDQDAQAASLAVHVYVNGNWGGAYAANLLRADIARAFPDAGSRHGYAMDVNLSGPGSHRVCVYGINTADGTINTELGCRTVVAPGANWAPLGSLDGLSVSGRTVSVSGWAVDEDVPTQELTVQVNVDGRLGTRVTADTDRGDVGRAFPAAGRSHGYLAGVDVPAGRHQVCVYALNGGAGTEHTALGCRTVTIAATAWDPFGNVDNTSVTGRYAIIRGWAVDPDGWATPSAIHLYVDGRFAGIATASLLRVDVGRVHRQAGSRHGFAAYIQPGSGRHTVCAYAINIGQGTTNPLLGCRTVTV
jgi:uncharacterized protein with LGFP repeats